MASNEIIMQCVNREVAPLPLDSTWSFERIEDVAPILAIEIRQAIAVANGASSLDNEVDFPDAVHFFNKDSAIAIETGVSETAMVNTLDGRSILLLDKQVLNKLSYLEFIGALQHEFGHDIQFRSDLHYPDNMRSIKGHKEVEFMADRIADAAPAMATMLLIIKTHPDRYNYDATYEVYPNTRSRIGALLAENYGNVIFQGSGSITDDGVFHPKLDDGLPVTEDGLRVSNWNAIEHAINQQVKADLLLLDDMVDGGLTDVEIVNFTQHVNESTQQFKQTKTHQLLDDALEPLLPESVSYHQIDMKQVNAAIQEILDSGLSEVAQRKTIAMVSERIAQHVEHQNYSPPIIMQDQAAQVDERSIPGLGV